MRSAAILAGGLATRFGGRDKSALVVDGRSILERQIAELSPVVDDLMILDAVAARLAERRLVLRELFLDVPTRIVTAEEMFRFGAPSRLLANVNTPAEYAHLEALQGHKL